MGETIAVGVVVVASGGGAAAGSLLAWVLLERLRRKGRHRDG